MFEKMVMWIFCTVFFALQGDSGSDIMNYDKWKLLKLGGVKAISSRNEIISYLENDTNIRIISMLKDSFQVGIKPLADLDEVMRPLNRFHLDVEIQHPDIGKLVKNSRKKMKRSLEKDYFDSYMNLEQMENYFDHLEASYPGIIQRRIVGQSYEGRNISLFIISSKNIQGNSKTKCQPNIITNVTCSSSNLGVKKKENRISSPSPEIVQLLRQKDLQLRRERQHSGNREELKQFAGTFRKRRQASTKQVQTHANSTHALTHSSRELLKNRLKKMTNDTDKGKINLAMKPVVFIDAGTHSREWVSPASTLYFIKKLAETPSLTSKIDWFVIPMVNPDGYLFSWNNDRFWRKTRSQSGSSGCHGADLNRNFNNHWGEVDTSKNPCSEHYGGDRPHSEKETVIISDLLIKEQRRLKAYISIHNWGQDILFPYCYSDQILPRDAAILERVSNGMADAIRNAHKEIYKKGRGSIMLYPASGTSIDWAYDILGVIHSYLIELRDKNGLLGFLLPDTFIKPTGEDIFAAMGHLASILENEDN